MWTEDLRLGSVALMRQQEERFRPHHNEEDEEEMSWEEYLHKMALPSGGSGAII